MLHKVALVLREYCRIEAPALMVVGVSGGPDSLCLMHALHALGHRPIIAHLDHELRSESAVEAAAVETEAASLGLHFVMQRADVRAHARSRALSIEAAARELRYEFLFTEARRHAAHAVAVGHNADDQVETVLMRLIRGAGMTGLKAMSYRSVLPQFDTDIPLIRPLLGIWRSETVDYCASNSLAPHHDRSNDSLEYFRNRVRHELLPALESYNPRVRLALWRTAETLASDLALVEERVTGAWHQTVLRQSSDFVCFDALELARQSVPLQRRLILAAAEHLRPAVETSFSALEGAADFVADASSSRLDLGGGLTVFREADAIYVSLGRQSLPFEQWPQMRPDSVRLPQLKALSVPLANGWRFTADYVSAAESPMQLIPRGGDGLRVYLDADTLPAPLELRPPHAGDRFQPLGLQGHSQKLSDFFVNAKLPARARRRWPLLCSGQTLIWVPGFRPAEAFRLRKETRQVACFAVTPAT
ncbi:MAG: tRNA lysidine(34) synthetase TilS [Chloroflexota bacterium]